jgi:hypothetical protein
MVSIILINQSQNDTLVKGIVLPGDQEGRFKLAIQLRKFLFITL